MDEVKKSKKVLFVDAYSASHVGNDVLLDSSIQLLSRVSSEAEYRVHAQEPESFVESLGLDCYKSIFSDIPQGGNKFQKVLWLIGCFFFMSLQVLNALTIKISPHVLTTSQLRRQALKDIADADIVVSIGGEMINDSFRKTLPMYMFIFWLSVKMNKKVLIFPQSIGPLNRKWTRWLTAHVLAKCTVVTARDRVSLEELKSLGLKGAQALWSPDVGVEQPVESIDVAEEALVKVGVNKKNGRILIGVVVSNWIEEGILAGNYLDILADSLIYLAKSRDIEVLFLPANMPVYGNDDADYKAAKYVEQKISATVITHCLNARVYSARLYKAIVGRMDVVVSTRMHAVILSTMVGTPTVTINTQRKLFGFMDNIGQQRLSIDIGDLTPEQLVSCISSCVENNIEIRRELQAGYEKVAQELGQYVTELRSYI